MQQQIKEYYGRQLKSSKDLKTNACCDQNLVPNWLKPLLAKVHPEVLSRYYGCGLVCPPLLQGCRILDLGCGTGRDAYVLAQLVGAQGEVIGVDMTQEQLAVAEKYQQYHVDALGFNNVQFLHGYIEQLDALNLEPESFDVIISNCVINLSMDKNAVLAGVRRLLKPGGEFYFADVYVDRRLPESVKNHPVLYGECLGGALYWNDFINLCKQNHFTDPRLVTDKPIEIGAVDLANKVNSFQFFSATYRLFKIADLEADCEDYGQAVIYQGTIAQHETSFQLDKHHNMEVGRVFPVCGNTWRMLHDTRFKPHFHFIGDFSNHYGLFQACGKSIPFDLANQESGLLGIASAGNCC